MRGAAPRIDRCSRSGRRRVGCNERKMIIGLSIVVASIGKPERQVQASLGVVPEIRGRGRGMRC